MNRFDVIIAGSGLGGLCCGVILAKEGLSVCVVEKEPAVGGCLRSFRRGDSLFDTGMHYVGCMDRGQMLDRFLRYAGIRDRLHLQRLDDEAYDRVILGDREYRFAQGYERFTDSLMEQFPDCREDVLRYVGAVRETGGQIGADKLREGVLFTGGMASLADPASQRIERLVRNPLLRKVVAATNFLYDGIRDRSPFHTHAMIQHSFINGAVRFADGSGRLAEELAGVIRACGGEVRCRARVCEVAHDGSRVTGVVLQDGERLFAPRVVSDLHPAELLRLIPAGGRIRPSYIRRINSLENSFGIFTVCALVDGKRFPYRNCNYYLADPVEVWSDALRLRLPHTVMVSMQAHSRPAPCEIVTLLMPCRPALFGRWADTRTGRRGADYEEFKERLARHLIRYADRRLNGLESAVRKVFTASPLTYRDYTGVKDGSAYGIMNDCLRPLESMLNPVTRLEGLYLTGQNVNNHGALGVLMTSIATCGGILGQEYVCRQIGREP